MISNKNIIIQTITMITMHKHNTELSPLYITVMSDQYQKSGRQKNLGKQIVSAGYICKQMGESLAKIDKMYSILLYVCKLL